MSPIFVHLGSSTWGHAPWFYLNWREKTLNSLFLCAMFYSLINLLAQYYPSYIPPFLSIFRWFIHSSKLLWLAPFSFPFLMLKLKAVCHLSFFPVSQSLVHDKLTFTGFLYWIPNGFSLLKKEHTAHKQVVERTVYHKRSWKIGINILICHNLLIVLKWNQVTDHPNTS